MRNLRRTTMAGAAGATSLVLALTGCSSSGDGNGTKAPAKALTQSEIDKAMDTPTTITFWSWLPNIQDQIDLFEKKYPKIKVVLVNQGDASAQYVKLRAAVKAGQGVPDVAQVGYDYLPSFTQTKSLLELTPYGADKIASDFVPGVWSQVVQNGGIYAVPQDSGPMGTLYRTDILSKAGVDAPATWADFATAAQEVKSKTGAYITNLPGNDMPQTLGFFSQAGASLFTYDGKTTVGINVDNDVTQKVVAYWQDLIQKDLVSTDPDFTDAWYQGLSRGKYATWLTAAWGPTFLAGSAKNTSGAWRAATLPQWSAGQNVSGNWGGSSDAVMAATKNPIPAYELAKFINNDPSSTIELANKQSLYPTTISTLSSPAFTDAKSDFYGGQQVNKFFADVSSTVPQNQKYVPFEDYVNSSYNDTLGKAIADHGDLKAALSAWQQQLVTYAKQQGFSVK
ncbi:ABC transporter substrate-binding protein [Kitasatospora cineracea]|uniref:Carbohydrate ABC transporter substrate-binding protein (CUT1 family) n=1 Tax=Kitasatospora cineracea TaxID=88074 RepID=A0A8G1XEU5_9ACTN|nr:sugar ABC transporter substrate-binding protein [Kitasatospora cineracea]ROR46548.1 carbohydrate ABC transporter substrate-binding protein (CUT1 family) [Kitasatospora cineracea]